MQSKVAKCLFGVILFYGQSIAQVGPPSSARYSKAIEDNSFLIEEAFNQEPGVVQHISTMSMFSTPANEAVYSFTQEWPLTGMDHQVGFTVPYAFTNPTGAAGLGDLLLNYRYQLFTSENWAAVSPRLSVILPTGSVESGLGAGTAGIQLAVPVSKRVSEGVILHFNVYGSLIPNVKRSTAMGSEVKQTLDAIAIGGSAIWLAGSSINLLLELLAERSADIDDGGVVVRETETVVSPGVRLAFDVGDLQIVPGLGVPVKFAGGTTHTGVFLYLSFEHSF